MTMSLPPIVQLVESVPVELKNEWFAGPLLLCRSLPVVELRGDTIVLDWGSEIIKAKKEQCHFRIGRAWQMKFGSRGARPLLPFGRHDLILIDFPPLQKSVLGKVWGHTTAPVGYTKESLVLWIEALRWLVDDRVIKKLEDSMDGENCKMKQH